eukprot:7970673-Lingulodinium_polyedra.AAC.1
MCNNKAIGVRIAALHSQAQRRAESITSGGRLGQPIRPHPWPGGSITAGEHSKRAARWAPANAVLTVANQA